MLSTGELPEQMPAKIEISEEEWTQAKKLQQQKMQNNNVNTKIRRKDPIEEINLKHSFITVIDPTSRSPKLYGLANNGQFLGVGEFGKTKLAVDEDGNFVAVKVITTVVKKSDIITSEKSKPNEDSEAKIEARLGRNKGNFNMYSPSRKPRKREPAGMEIPLAEDEIALKKYQVVDYLGVSLKDILEGKKDKSGKVIAAKIHLSDEQKQEIAIGLLEAIKLLHAKNVLHNDIHPGNILVDLNKKPIKVSIIDFGLSYELNPDESEVSIIGRQFNKNILAPEIEQRHHLFLSRKTDAWQVGNVLLRALGVERWYVYSLYQTDNNLRRIIDDKFIKEVKEYYEHDDEVKNIPKGVADDFIPTDGGYGTFVVQREDLENMPSNKSIQSAEDYLEKDGIHGPKNAHRKITF